MFGCALIGACISATVINTSLDAISKAKENKGNNQSIKEIAKDYSKDLVVDSMTSLVSSVAASKLVEPIINEFFPPIKAGKYPKSLPGFIKGKRGQQFMGSILMVSVISGEVSEAMSPVVKWGIQQIPKLISFV